MELETLPPREGSPLREPPLEASLRERVEAKLKHHRAQLAHLEECHRTKSEKVVQVREALCVAFLTKEIGTREFIIRELEELLGIGRDL